MSSKVTRRLAGGPDDMPEHLTSAEAAMVDTSLDALIALSSIDNRFSALTFLRVTTAIRAQAMGLYHATQEPLGEVALNKLSAIREEHLSIGEEAGGELVQRRRTACH